MALTEQNSDQPVERGRALPRPGFARMAALPWADVLTAGIFLGVIGCAAWFSAADGDDIFERLGSFLTEAYQSGDIQVLLGMAVFGLVLEKIIPGRRQDMNNLTMNIGYSAMVLLFVGAVVPLQVMVADSALESLGWRNIFDLKFDAGQSTMLAVAAMVINALILDFFFYWFHRTQHTFDVMWQIHLLHHSDMALNVTTTHRVHFLEHLLTPFFMTVPIMILFDLPDREAFWIAAVPQIWSYFVHANARIGFGRFWWLLTSPQWHRIHHSILPQHHNRNYAVWFPIYDVMFGSAYVPKPDEYPPSGVEGVSVSKLPHAFLLPFRQWRQMAKSRMRPTARID